MPEDPRAVSNKPSLQYSVAEGEKWCEHQISQMDAQPIVMKGVIKIASLVDGTKEYSSVYTFAKLELTVLRVFSLED